ncbi:MAG: DUF4097 family beta strand repeat protein [Acidobacteriota bacterium]|nr:MAG: DUF4097 family beta strand repeat protein [Acidobacteriota bacterium]
MFKRIATLLLGIGLIGLGVFFFVTPERSQSLQFLTRYWPIFLILAGLVRVAGHLIDRHPASPVGGFMITAIGGILLSANLRGEHSFIRIFGAYWFWLLVAYILGRVLRQYTARDGKRPHAFSAGAVTLMILIISSGLGAHFLGRNQSYINSLNARLGRMAGVRDYLFGSRIEIGDDTAQELALKAGSRLVVDGMTGEVKITSTTGTKATVRLYRRIRTVDEDEARQIARRIKLRVGDEGEVLRLGVDATGVENDFNTLILVEIPKDSTPAIEVVNALGATTLEGLRGDQVINNGEQIEVADHEGRIRIDNPRGSVTLRNIRGDVELLNYRRNAELSRIVGSISLDMKGGRTLVEQSAGPIRARVSDARLELAEIGSEPQPTPQSGQQPPQVEPAVIVIEETRNGRLEFRNIRGPLRITAQNNTRINLETVTGNMMIENTSGRIVARHITGQARIRSRDGSIEIDGITGPIVAETSHDIKVTDFRDSLDLSSRMGSINITTDEKITAGIKANNEKGSISVRLPENAEFRMDAMTEFGRVRIRGFDQLNFTRQERTSVQGINFLDSAPLITLRSVSGNIQLQSNGAAVASRDF